MSAVYPYRRRSPFAPYDPNEPDDSGMYAPNYGGGGMPQPPPQQPPPSMYAPSEQMPPTSDFDQWYADRAQGLGLNRNPDDPQHHYDYRAAFEAGADADSSGHWPSQFKTDDHPNRFVGGMDTKYGGAQLFTPPQMPSMSTPTKDVTQSAPLRDPLEAANSILSRDNNAGGQGIAQRRTNLAGDPLPEMPEPPTRIPYPKYNPFSLGHANAYARQAVDAENDHNDKIYQARIKAWETMTSAKALGGTGTAEAQAMFRALNAQTPEERAYGERLLNESRRFSPTAPKPTPYEDWRTQNPGAPVKDWLAMQPSMYQNDQRPFAKSLTFSPDGTPIVFDPNAGRAAVMPGYQPSPPANAPPNFGNVRAGTEPAPPPGSQQPASPQKGILPQGPYTKGGGGVGSMTAEEVKLNADAVQAGRQDPTLKNLGRAGAGKVKAELERRGYNLAAAVTDWNGVQKSVATMNGPQQLRLRQAINTAPHILDTIEDLTKQWDAGQFPLLNKAQMSLAVNGVLGPKAQQIATSLRTQITDLVADLGNIYMGGNSPTDYALALAGQNLSADWGRDQLLNAISLARKNVEIRKNSIATTGAAGVSPGSPYSPQMREEALPTGPSQTLTNFHVNPKTGERVGWNGTAWVAAPK